MPYKVPQTSTEEPKGVVLLLESVLPEWGFEVLTVTIDGQTKTNSGIIPPEQASGQVTHFLSLGYVMSSSPLTVSAANSLAYHLNKPHK